MYKIAYWMIGGFRAPMGPVGSKSQYACALAYSVIVTSLKDQDLITHEIHLICPINHVTWRP